MNIEFTRIYRSDEEINYLLERCTDAAETGTNFRGMSYEEGIKVALEWLLYEPDTVVDDIDPLE